MTEEIKARIEEEAVKKPIVGLSPEDREDVRYMVNEAMRYYPNSHLGDMSSREDMRSAFKFVRQHFEMSGSIQQAVGALQLDVLRYVDM